MCDSPETKCGDLALLDYSLTGVMSRGPFMNRMFCRWCYMVFPPMSLPFLLDFTRYIFCVCVCVCLCSLCNSLWNFQQNLSGVLEIEIRPRGCYGPVN